MFSSSQVTTVCILLTITVLLILEVGTFVYLLVNTTYEPAAIGGVISSFITPTLTAVVTLITHQRSEQELRNQTERLKDIVSNNGNSNNVGGNP